MDPKARISHERAGSVVDSNDASRTERGTWQAIMYEVKVHNHLGCQIYVAQGLRVDLLRAAADAAAPNGDARVRADSTSDGTYQGAGKGRCVADRANGIWLIY